jgi:hypothetical protein
MRQDNAVVISIYLASWLNVMDQILKVLYTGRVDKAVRRSHPRRGPRFPPRRTTAARSPKRKYIR